LKNVRQFVSMGGLLAPGTDAGAWAVPHGSSTELPLLAQAGANLTYLQKGIDTIIQKF